MCKIAISAMFAVTKTNDIFLKSSSSSMGILTDTNCLISISCTCFQFSNFLEISSLSRFEAHFVIFPLSISIRSALVFLLVT